MNKTMSLKQRIGIDIGCKLSVEDGIRWAADNGVRFIDCEIDIEPNALESFDETRAGSIREMCNALDVHLGLHTLSAVNIAEFSPFVRDAVDDYLRAYIDAAVRLNAKWVVVHAGYHFTADRDRRIEVSLERLRRITDYAQSKGVKILLENLNWEPETAEVHYLAHTVDECLLYFNAIQSAALGWAFTVNHATLVPEGIAGFLKAMPTERLGEVRLADNNGEYELHMYPGEGIIDFDETFRLIEDTGYTGHYMNAFGSLDDRLRAREDLVRLASGEA